VVQYRNSRGKSKRLTISTTALMTLDQARDEARRKLQMARDGADPSAVRDQRRAEPTVNEVIDRWHAEYALENLVPKPSWPNAKSEVKQLRAWVGKLLVSEITRRMLAEWHKATEQAARPAASNGIVERLEMIWSWAEANDLLPTNAPTSTKLFWKFGYYKENKRKRRLTNDEYWRFYRAIQTHRERGDLNAKHLDLFELLLTAGLRLREGMFFRYDRAGRTIRTLSTRKRNCLSFRGTRPGRTRASSACRSRRRFVA
jgi:integrase